MASLVTPICRKLSRGKCKSSILHIKLDFINWILPSIQPSLSQLMKAFSTLEVDVEVDFVPSLVQAHDVVLVSRSSAAASLETIIQEIPNPKQYSGQFYSWAVLQHMPRLESNKRFWRRYVPGGSKASDKDLLDFLEMAPVFYFIYNIYNIQQFPNVLQKYSLKQID